MHQFMKYFQAIYLDLQFVVFPTSKKTSEILKTVTFMNSLAKIQLMMKIKQDWIKLLGYPHGSDNSTKPYYATTSEYEKN